MKIGLIDLGTNSVRMYIYEQHTKEDISSPKDAIPSSCPHSFFHEIYQKKIMVTLGEELFTTGKISKAAQKRTIEALHSFSEYFKSEKIKKIYAIATCAVREAENGSDFVDKVRLKTDINLHVISGEEEADTVARGVLHYNTDLIKPHLIVDIGGGSTELVLIANNKICKLISLPIGAVRCQERELEEKYPASKKGIVALRENIRKETKDFFKECEELKENIIIGGTSGSIRALVRLATFDKESPSYCKPKDIESLLKDMRDKKPTVLEEEYAIQPRRAKVIVAACVILDELCKISSADKIIAYTQGLKDGVIAKIDQGYFT